jgi:hypothetical protein
MAKKQANNQVNKKQITQPPQVKKNTPPPAKDILDSLDNFFLKREKFVLYIGLFLTILFSLLLFDVKVGPGGDDSAYIQRAYDFVHSFAYPGYQGALYPLLLSLFIWLFGIKLILLKFLSLIFMAVSMYFFYKAFSKKVPQSLLAISFILLSFNYYLLYFSSQTYNEAFFMMVQAIFFWYLAKNFILDKANPSYKNFLILGLLLFLLTLTKNVAYASIAAVIGYFILTKQWKSAWKTLAGFFIFDIPFEIVKRIVWGSSGLQMSSQGSGLMLKDFYNPSKGNEDFIGFLQRLVDNSNLYFSKHFFKFLGFRPEITEISPFLTIITWLLLGVAFYWAFRKNKLLLFTSIYTILLCLTTFLVLQKSWDQWRLIIIVFPFLLLLGFSSFYHIGKLKGFGIIQVAVPILAIIIFFTSFFKTTLDKTNFQTDVLSHNLEGEMLYGLTPDWVNYIKMSEWAAKNTPANALTGVRKTDISFIYGGRKFFGITKVYSISADSLFKLMPDSFIYIGVRIEKIDALPFFKNPSFKAKTIGFISGKFSFGDNDEPDGNVVGIYKFSPSEWPEWEKQIKTAGVFYDTNIKTWITKINQSPTDFAILQPDGLLDYLKKNHVKYLMLASLRMNPYENTGSIVNTLQRYVYFIQLKYPNVFRVVQTIGDDEVAQLVEINYP